MGKKPTPENELTEELQSQMDDLPSQDENEIPSEDDALAKATALVDEFKEALQRERADFQNYRRRIEREKETLRPSITAEVMKRFLPVVDDFERAIGAIPADEKNKDWVVGILQIYRKFQNLLEAEGITILDPLGEPFDPNFHEAIGADEPTDECGSGHVSVVLQKGYIQGDKVLRPAMVRVAS